MDMLQQLKISSLFLLQKNQRGLMRRDWVVITVKANGVSKKVTVTVKK